MEEPQPQNGIEETSIVVAETDDDPVIGPGTAPRSRPKRPLQFEQAYLDALPSAHMYALEVYVFFWDQLLGFRVYTLQI